MIQKLYRWYGKKTVRLFLLAFIAILIAGFFLKGGKDALDTNETEGYRPTVTLSPVHALNDAQTLTIIGSVEAVSEAGVETETAGRITSVPVEIGDTVAAGSVVAKIENASQYAALLQAEGAYEAAVAAASQSDVSVADAETSFTASQNDGLNVYRSAFTTTDDIVRNLVDDLFNNPGELSSGFRLDSLGDAVYLNEERRQIEVLLDTWSLSALVPQDTENALQLLNAGERDVRRIAQFVEAIATIISDEDNALAEINGVGIESYKTEFFIARNNLNTLLQNVTSARTAIENAQEALQRAQISGTNTEVSVANAQVKQALGSLHAAQATYAKTIIRTPIKGTVNKVSVNVGDFVGAFSPVATIANNDILEITAFVGALDRDVVAVGSEVLIENAYAGTISNIAPAVDPVTKKTEITIHTETNQLANGDTVRVSIRADDSADTSSENKAILVPLTAIKFSATDGMVFTVADGVIVAHDVVLGSVSGSNIAITEGITSDMEIVLDTRGLSAGQSVLVNTQ